MADDNKQLLTDIGLVLRRNELRPVYAVAVTSQREVSSRKKLRRVVDMGLVSSEGNLGQAVVLRLLTPRGELAELAHPDYGSRLHELIGRPNTPTTHNLLKLFILESLKQEPRIEAVEKIRVEPHKVNKALVIVSLKIKPAGASQSVTIGPFTLELTP